MSKRGLLVALFFAVSLLLSGCQTATGLGKGVAYGVAATAEGISKDSQDFWKFMNKADEWVKDNLW